MAPSSMIVTRGLATCCFAFPAMNDRFSTTFSALKAGKRLPTNAPAASAEKTTGIFAEGIGPAPRRASARSTASCPICSGRVRSLRNRFRSV
jgi:hypothetical protein